MKMLSHHLKIDRCYIDERAISRVAYSCFSIVQISPPYEVKQLKVSWREAKFEFSLHSSVIYHDPLVILSLEMILLIHQICQWFMVLSFIAFMAGYQTLERSFKSDLRSDQDHLLKKDLKSDQDHIFFLSDLDLKSWSKIIFCPKCPLFEGQNFKTDKKSTLNFWNYLVPYWE
jgi:hypothetical protein